MVRYLRIMLTIVVIIAAIFAGRWVWTDYMHTPWTRDGRIRADIVTIVPDVSGWVTKLNVKDGQQVAKGELLFSVDQQRYQAAYDKSKANTNNSLYSWELAKHKYERRKALNTQQAISEESLEATRISTEIAKANYDLAKADQTVAQLNLSRTQVTAPVAGQIINLNLRQGNYVAQGTPVFAIVQSDSFYVTGYFEETKIPLIHTNQKATIELLSDTKPLTGQVVSIGKAIANINTQSNNQLLPQVQQTFNWVRLSQRIPVDIKLDALPEGIQLSAGMTATIHLATE
ncbi:HlyD family secretion protein [Pseudoalteromonas sp. SR44-5]|uniref:efflux RND transporter periplasmic adaptor subunit n=1 Tax=Pseudoalteromonas TaxID=53246 RepID=UPI0012316A83|nr:MULTISPECIES: HlyD family secretion protein [Pseudoalteromonas]MBB1335028.1 HlyD family secretion protein [Pseudoalteromonas sp. SR41-6]MBB1368295.1 HlyD family secretion protein [Pseudoalteromonas sp. SR44-5]MBB1434901.1 HlyD family secretion protein [Pseudoalteromonas sp. SG43-6]MBB1460311.1 HlyD family secretion protein [Pseudoalteromonas sp. SG41-8]